MQPQTNLPAIQVEKFLTHFQAMMGPYGLYQHATLRVPLLSEGYCTDDNARAVTMLIALKRQVRSKDLPLIDGLLGRCWQFIVEAQEKPGKFLNFRSANGDWLPQDQSEDMYARVIRAATAMQTYSQNKAALGQAEEMLGALLQRAALFMFPRAWAETVIALAEINKAQPKQAQVESIAKLHIKNLLTMWKSQATPAWPWFEASMTYANAMLPYGLLAGLTFNQDAYLKESLKSSAQFLIQTTNIDNIFVPIGSRGWYPKGGIPSTDNQQAIEAALMFEFLLKYQSAFPGLVREEEVIAPYLWFFGHNTGKTVLALPDTGACLDGLFSDGPNPNQGAESMLAYQWAEICARMAPVSVQQRIIQALKKPL